VSRGLAALAVLLLAAAPTPAQEEPQPTPTGAEPAAPVESGTFVYARGDQPFGSESYTVHRRDDGTRLVQVRVGFKNAKVRGTGRLVLDAEGMPVGYSFLVERAQSQLSITVELDESGDAHCVVREHTGAKRVLLDRTVELPPGAAWVEEGVITFDGLALARYDRERGGQQEIPVLVAQLGEVHAFVVTAEEEEDVSVGPDREVRALRLRVAYRGVQQHYWLDDQGQLVRCVSQGVEVVRTDETERERR